MKQPRCTRTSPSSCCRTTSPPVASLSITSSVYVKQILLQAQVPFLVFFTLHSHPSLDLRVCTPWLRRVSPSASSLYCWHYSVSLSFFPVDWWSSSCPDPSPEWPNHQPRKSAMRHHLSGLTMMVTDTLSQVADWSRTACYQTTVAEIRGDCLLFHNAPRLSSITFLIVAKQLLALCMCFVLSDGMDAYGT